MAAVKRVIRMIAVQNQLAEDVYDIDVDASDFSRIQGYLDDSQDRLKGKTESGGRLYTAGPLAMLVSRDSRRVIREQVLASEFIPNSGAKSSVNAKSGSKSDAKSGSKAKPGAKPGAKAKLSQGWLRQVVEVEDLGGEAFPCWAGAIDNVADIQRAVYSLGASSEDRSIVLELMGSSRQIFFEASSVPAEQEGRVVEEMDLLIAKLGSFAL
jgi:hypothetical protein